MHRAHPSAPAYHAVSNTTAPQLVVYSYWYLQGKINTTTTQMVVYSYWDLQGKVCPPTPGLNKPLRGAQLGILSPPGTNNPLGVFVYSPVITINNPPGL